MALTQVTGPYPIFTDLDGTPLDDGYLYIGEINEDPQTNPIQVYWDSALTIVATQPIRTNSGYAYRNGSPALLYTAGEFSITIRNKRQEFVLYSPVGYGFDPAAVSASVVKNDFVGDGVETDFTLSASPSTILATNIFINGVYQEKDSYSLLGNVITFSIAPPLSSSIEVMTNETGVINSGNATAISYTAGFPGATAQTVQTKLEQYVSVKDFGAVGDGVTNDTAAIQAAVTASKAVDFGGAENNYLVNGTITLQSGQTLIGSATITQDATQAILFNADNRDNVTIRGLRMIGKSEATFFNSPSSLAIAIRANNATDLLVDGCRFENFYYTSLAVLTGGSRIHYINNFAKGPGAAVLGVDINYRNCIGAVILGSGVIISGNDVYDTASGIILAQGSSNAIVANNTLHDFINEHGLYVDTGVRNITIIGNTIRNTGADGDGLKVQHYTSFGVAPYNITIIGNTIENTGNTGISAYNSVPTGSPVYGHNISIVGNTIRDVESIGINLRYYKNATISGNTIYTAGSEGVDITGCEDVILSNNQISFTELNGIYLASVGGNNRIKVQGNQLYHPGLVGDASANSVGIRMSGGDYISIEGNRIVGNGVDLEYGIFIENGDQTSLSLTDNDVFGANYAVRYKNATDALLALRDNLFNGVILPSSNTAPLTSIASAASIIVPTNARVVRITGTTNITSIATNGHTGSVVTFLFDGVLTVVRGGALVVASNFTTSASDTLTMCCDGDYWFEISRSVN
jgi:hypothetical protein